jgi:O-antigen/teichoic acid export membrane protein
MSEVVNASLRSIAKGAGITLTGTVISLILGFVCNIIIIRNTSPSDYGIYSLATVIVYILVMIATLGLGDGTTRCIAYIRGKGDNYKIQDIVISTLQIGIISSLAITILSILMSSTISVYIFKKEDLLLPLRFLSLTVPFVVLIDLFNAVFRGFNRAEPGMIFLVARYVVFTSILTICILIGFSFQNLLLAYFLSVFLTFVAFLLFALKGTLIAIRKLNFLCLNGVSCEILQISVPILAVNMLITFFSWTNVLMIGYFKSSEEVGVYNVAFILASLILIFVTSLGSLYMPVASKLYIKNHLGELHRIYAISTKWCFIGSFPFFCVLLLFPNHILEVLYGQSYSVASMPLQILAAGMLTSCLTGPNFHTLIAMGRTNLIVRTYMIGGATNFLLNIFLIPTIGISGAAIASAFSIALVNVALSLELYKIGGIHPLTRTYGKILISSTAILLCIYLLSMSILSSNIWVVVGIFILVSIMFLSLMLVTRSFDGEDLAILLELERITGRNFTKLRKCHRT